VENESRIDIVSAGVENWIVVSKLRLAVHETQSYKPAFQDLSNACSLIDSYDDMGSIPVDRIAELRRCMSGAFWNLGSSIHQAGRWDHSIPFISKGVEIDQTLVDSHWSLVGTSNNAWDTFYQQLPKRALLLAGCFVKLGDRKVCSIYFFDALDTY
jgi:separase